MSLLLHRAGRADRLAELLAELLREPLADPFAKELVLVPARGVERWLSQRLSHRLGHGVGHEDGVCSGVELRSPASLVAEVTGTRDSDPWAPDALVWPLLGVVDAHAGEPWCRALSEHLGHGRHGEEAELRRGRRYAVARRLARLFASYAGQRPVLLQDWEAGRDTDGAGGPLAPDLLWQAELWRRLVAEVAGPTPAERHARVVASLREDPSSADLPSRFSLFGHTRIAVTEAQLLAALGEHRDVHLWLPHPSDALWQALRDLTGAVPRSADESHRRAGHPLLVSLGRDLRELERTLGSVQPAPVEQPPVSAPEPGAATLLSLLQHDISRNAVPEDPTSRTLEAADRSVQVHACHGPARQVEVLREVLLGLLADDPTLEPRDILVMCPDIEAYAPLVEAAFGMGGIARGAAGADADWHPGQRLQVRLADRSLTQTNPLLAVIGRLLDLAGGRAGASEVLDLLESRPVRRRFGFKENDLETIMSWVEQAGIRWAYDERHRDDYGLADYVQNTWRFGLDRVLAGVAMSDDAQESGPGWIGTTLPLDDVGSTSIDLAGRLAEFLARLEAVTDRLVGSHRVDHWLDALHDGIGSLTDVARGDEWQVGQVQRELVGLSVDAARQSGGGLELRLPDVRALMAERLSGRPTRANFRTGTLTVCTMVPMRSVPHRVVCLLGVDDGVFPRFGLADGDDVLARRPLTGERDVRSEDRQLMLDAILAATESLVVTYTGADEHSGQPRPPAVPLGELLDALDRTTPAPVRESVVVHHPLQPFDRLNLEPGRLGTPGPFTFDPTALVAATAAAGARPVHPPFLAGPLTVPGRDDVELADLLTFFRDPVRGFFRSLDLTLPWEVDGVSDAMPVEIDNLVKWQVGDRMLRDMLAGVHPDGALQAEWRRGTLPPGRLGWRTGTEIRENAMQLAIAALTHRQVAPEAFDVDVDLGGRRLTGTVPSVYAHRLVSVGYSRLDARQLLSAWVQLLALSVHDEDRSWTGLVIGRAARGTRPAARLFAPVGAESVALLADLVAIYDAGRREPLPLPLKTSFAWSQARATGNDPALAAGDKWLSKRFDGENARPAHVRVWGPNSPLDPLLEPVRAVEERPGETTRLGAYAARVWEPMLRFERDAP
ncbi:MAG: exodeoxyribonuclease V subunit gamma [Marmoricola sp.]